MPIPLHSTGCPSAFVRRLALIVALAMVLPASAGDAPPAEFRLGEQVTVEGRPYHVARQEADGSLLLTPPQPPTAELGAFIKTVAVEASSQQEPRGANKIIDGSGFGESFPGSGVYEHTNNVYADGTSMWNSEGGDKNAWVRFDLGQVHRVNGAYIWNYNESGEWSGYGMKQAEIRRSTDGEHFESVGTFELTRAPGRSDYRGQTISFDGPVEARYMEIRARSNHGGNHVGLAEVRFSNADAKAEAAGAWTPTYEQPEHPQLKPGQPLAGAENITFPADANVVDVTQAPYHAKADGVTDDTAAIQRALDHHPNAGAIIYLPNGIYLISDTLRWPGPDDPRASSAQKRTVLWGQSRAGTVIRLRDSAPGFENPRKSKALIWTGRAPAQRFGNEVHNLTLDTGVDNPGASGAMFIANNQGGMYNVSIISGDGQGVAGLNLAYTDEQGPALIRNVSVQGFDVGIATAHSVASLTFEHVTVTHQNVAGFQNDGQPVSIRGLRSVNDVPAVMNNGGLMVLIDSELQGSGAAERQAAVVNNGTIFLRNIQTPGYDAALHDRRRDHRIEGSKIGEYRSDPPRAEVSDADRTMDLPIKETPELPWDPHDQWIAPQAFGEVSASRDTSQLIQQAIDAGKTTVYLPRGHYRIDRTVVLRGDVRRFIGNGAWLSPGGKVAAGEEPMFRFADGTHPVVRFEGISTDFSNRVQLMEHAASRTLVMSRVMCNFQGGGITYRNTGRGDLFIEDVVGQTFHFKDQTVYARQFNPEPIGTKAINEGGTLWVLGMKWERGGSALVNRDGARTEILGGLSQTHDGGRAPMIINEDASASVIVCETNYSDAPYRELVINRSTDQERQWVEPDGKFRGFRLISFEARESNHEGCQP